MLTYANLYNYGILQIGGVGVAGSNPVVPTNLFFSLRR